MAKNNATLPDIKTLLQAGIDPKTGLPLKFGGGVDGSFKPANKRLLEIIDRQDAIGRYEWFNLPEGLSGDLIERILYYRGQGMFFYMKETDGFYFLPYALDGTIDVYGRYTDVTPLPFNGSTTEIDGKGPKPWINGLRRKCVYDIVLDEDMNLDYLYESCVLLHDYTIGISQTITPRAQLQEPLLDVMSDIIPFMRTALLNSTGIQAMRVQGEDEQSNVEAASRSINRAALEGKKFIPVIGGMDFQDLTGGEVAKSEEFFLALQSLDNYRLSQYGINNGGLFQKKEHMLQAEQIVNQREDSYAMKDGLRNRQEFCDIINSIWGFGTSCEVRSDVDMMGVPAYGTDDDSYGSSEEDEDEYDE